MKICKRIAAMLLCLLAVGLPVLRCLPITTFAQAEQETKGSITVTVKLDKSVKKAGSLTLYRVGEISEAGDSFVPTGRFTEWGDSFGDIAADSAKLAEKLAAWTAEQKNLKGNTQRITKDSKGNFSVTFAGLETGLYLLVQDSPAAGYNKISPFLVTIPYHGEYHVDANSKTELEKKPGPSTPTNPPTSPKPGEKLPQTGQLNWPVPVMAILGMTLFAVGWVLRFRKRDDNAR